MSRKFGEKPPVNVLVPLALRRYLNNVRWLVCLVCKGNWHTEINTALRLQILDVELGDATY